MASVFSSLPHYYFIRVGEDYNDIEVNGGFWDNSFGMRIERRIVLEDAG